MTATAAVASDCTRYQDALIDFVDCGDAGHDVAAALAHLERCEACTRDLAATALVLTALRRMFDEARAADSPADAWPRLRARVSGRQRRQWAPGTITGLVTGAALVTVLLLPNAARLDSAVYPAGNESSRLEAIRMQLPRDADEDTFSMRVHLDRANSVGSVHEAPPPAVEVSIVGPWPDNVRPAPVTTASNDDADLVSQRALRPV